VSGGGGLTFVFTDIEGSTRLVEELEVGWGLALRICRRILETAFDAHGGRVFGNEGDGQFFVFPTPVAAASAAVDAQRRISASEWPEGIAFRVRMGIHCGPVRVSGGEYVGLTIHEVARICSAANGGQVLCSAAVADALASCPDIDAVNLGRYVLRGIAGSRDLFQLAADGLDGDPVSPREAVREGGRRVTIWRREPPAPRVPDGAGDGRVEWRPKVPGVEVIIRTTTEGGAELMRVTVLRDGVVEEEYDGLTIGGACDISDIVNTCSRLISIATS